MLPKISLQLNFLALLFHFWIVQLTAQKTDQIGFYN